MPLIHIFKKDNYGEHLIGCYPIKTLSDNIVQKFLIQFFLDNLDIPEKFELKVFNCFPLSSSAALRSLFIKNIKDLYYLYAEVRKIYTPETGIRLGEKTTYNYTYLAFTLPEIETVDLNQYLTNPNPLIREYLKDNPELLK